MITVCPDDNTLLSGRRVHVDGRLEWLSWCWRCRRGYLDDGRVGLVHDPTGVFSPGGRH